MIKDIEILQQALQKSFKEGVYNMEEAALIINSYNRIKASITHTENAKEDKNEQKQRSIEAKSNKEG